MNLRPYQAEVMDRARLAMREHRRVLLQMPTGAGKTECFLDLARSYPGEVFIATHRKELRDQTSRRLAPHPHNVILPAVKRRGRHNIHIGTIQTVVRRLRQYNFNLIILDEAHHATATQWRKVIDCNPEAAVLGVTATPCRLGGAPLGDLFTHMVTGPSVSELIDLGYLVEPEVYAPSGIDLSGLKRTAGDWNQKQLAERADKPTITGCAVDHYRKLADGLPAVAFCVSVAHAEHVAEAFCSAGYRAASIDGTMDPAKRDRLLRGLADGSLHVLTSCDLISEGVDVPAIACGILLRPTQSTALYIQQVGRCLRAYPGKDKAIILDHVGNCARHGLPDMDREWSLEAGYVPPAADQEPQYRVRTCAECFHVHAFAKACPKCGNVYPIAERAPIVVEGELTRVSGSLFSSPAEMDWVGQATGLWHLVEGEILFGKSPGWALGIHTRMGGRYTRQDLQDYAAIRAGAFGYKPGWATRWLQTCGWGKRVGMAA